MKLKQTTLTEEFAKQICNWCYEAPYDFYNLPSWEEMCQERYALCDSVKRQRFIGYLNEQDQLGGFVNLLNEDEHVFFGIGVHPDYCSKGIGQQIIALAKLECIRRYGQKPLYLEVRTWNKRAIRCYEAQGFKIIGIKTQTTSLGLGEFYEMKLY